MAQMIRKQIYIDADNDRFLKERSAELGVTEAEVVRQALDVAAQQVRAAKSDAAMDNILAYIREHRMGNSDLSDEQTHWKFNREEMYDEMYEERFERPRRRREEAEARAAVQSQQ